MRKPKYLSPTAILLFERDRQEFYLNYMADHRPPKIPQNRVMSIGAAFDAYVKTFLSGALTLGSGGFKFDEIFESQVEPQNRDWARKHGAYAFSEYQRSGALADLLLELQGSTSTPRFELTVEARVAHERVEGGVPFLGKPDVFYTTRTGRPTVLDWKVNGYVSPKTTSPKKGYVELYDNGSRRGFHRGSLPIMEGGLYVNRGFPLETVDETWATQLAIYSWLLGLAVGDEGLVEIHQLACKGGDGEGFPSIRVAAHRTVISSGWQHSLMGRCAEIWGRISKGEIFSEDNEATCKKLDDYYLGYSNVDNHPDSDWFNKATR